jgi:hypothetical protein
MEMQVKRSEVFIIMLGPKTKTAPGVLKELRVANEVNKSKFQIIGYALQIGLSPAAGARTVGIGRT